jgi:hypothetical protein
MDEDTRPYIRRPHVRRQILRLTLASLAITGVVLAMLWRFVGATSGDFLGSEHNCYRCLDGMGIGPTGEGWAVGDAPFLLRFAHGTWAWEHAPLAPGTVFFRDATTAPGGDGWAVGSAILRYHDGVWAQDATPVARASFLHAVAAPSAREAWAVGGRWGDDQGLIYHYWQDAWSVITMEGMELYGVSAPSPDEAWVVGAKVANHRPVGGILLHYQHGAWTPDLVTSHALYAISMISLAEGWVVGIGDTGEDVFLHYVGGVWTPMGNAPGVHLDHLVMASAEEGWASGFPHGPERGVLYHYRDGVWTRADVPPLDSINGVAAVAPGEVWVLGIARQGWRQVGVLMHYQVGHWTTQVIPRRPPNSLADALFQYVGIGLPIFIVIPLIWLLMKSLLVPRGSDWAHWLTRVGLIGGLCLCAGYLITAMLPLFDGDLPVNPSLIANAAEFGLLIPGVVLVGFARIAVPFVRA